ncbi:hypothetical protein MRS44_004303 [Fusarium solani]|uniref:uncharacterized protein n=1 Tax=Fusarium solani TaxID=169388 RepID=UPI0032C45F2C|nr:hypothetical protein MRS44_004303 [Fusarium solani]
MGGEAQGCVRLCRAHEEGPVKHFARPPFLRCYAQSLDRSETLANKFVAAVSQEQQYATGQDQGQRRIRTEEGTRDSRVSASHQHCLSTQQHRADACLALMPPD